MSDKTALIIGASRGIGLGMAKELAARGYRVIATERSRSDELHAAAESTAIEIAQCDVTDAGSVTALKNLCGDNALDILICNAGIYGPKGGDSQSIMNLKPDAVSEIMMVNAVGPAQAVVTLLPSVKQGGTIGLLTSRMGSIDDSSGGANLYRISKVSQNILARSIFEDHAKARSIPVLSLHPGWVQTEMGGPNAMITVEESATGLIDLLEAEREPAHQFLAYDGRELAW